MPSGKTGRKRHRYFKVNSLPEELKTQMDEMLARGDTYKDISDFLKEKNHYASGNAVRNYHKFILEETEKTRAFETLWSKYKHEHEGEPIQDALIAVLLNMVAEILMNSQKIEVEHRNGKLTLGEVNGLIRSLTRIQSVRNQIDTRWDRVREKAASVAQEVGEAVTGKKGLSAARVLEIKAKILGITDIEDPGQ